MKKIDPLASLLGRVEDLDEVNLTQLVDRLARERRLLNRVVHTLREGVLVIEADGVIRFANQAAYDLLGLLPDQIGALSLWRAVPDLARALKFSHGGQLKEEVNLSREIALTYPERRIIRLYIVPFEDDPEADEGQLVRHIVILHDITQEKSQTEEEIETARVRSILQLSAGVAHELGNPLNSLTIHLQLMQRQLDKLSATPQTDKLGRSLEVCRGEVERLDGIITHFLDAVRPQPPDLADLDLVRVLEETLETLGPELEAAGISVELTLDGKVPLIDGDRQQLKQVLYNLLRNARQAMQSGGSIRIRAGSDDEFVYLQIGDTGVGIAEEDLPKVFQPYFTTKQSGHGLGMMISERIMRDHGGQIGLDSQPGLGTVVTLQFPQKHRRIRLLEGGR